MIALAHNRLSIRICGCLLSLFLFKVFSLVPYLPSVQYFDSNPGWTYSALQNSLKFPLRY
ncbi:hypothetical protein Sjap_014871 [Stephania japonica]|uniref:Uncharacterized protein n=1 Tax=Stephania japonica TaxID=461633 RepID=A0AAP0II34_9MAGN